MGIKEEVEDEVRKMLDGKTKDEILDKDTVFRIYKLVDKREFEPNYPDTCTEEVYKAAIRTGELIEKIANIPVEEVYKLLIKKYEELSATAIGLGCMAAFGGSYDCKKWEHLSWIYEEVISKLREKIEKIEKIKLESKKDNAEKVRMIKRSDLQRKNKKLKIG